VNNELFGLVPTEFLQISLNSLLLEGNTICKAANYSIFAASSDFQRTTECEDCGDPCGVGGTCQDGQFSYQCNCFYGYIGTDCEFDLNSCRSGPCLNSGICRNGINSFTCSCEKTGFLGPLCETPDPNFSICDPGYEELKNGTCLPCMPGTIEVGRKCVSCQLGTYSNETTSSDITDCQFCPQGTYTPSPGAISCISCGTNCRRASVLPNAAEPTPSNVTQTVLVDGVPITDVEDPVVLGITLSFGYYYLFGFLGLSLIVAIILLPFHRLLRKYVAFFAVVLRTPFYLLQMNPTTYGLTEIPSFMRGLIGIWVIIGVVAVTAYQVHIFIDSNRIELSAVQPGTIYSNGESTSQTFTTLSLSITLYNTPITCSPEFTFQVIVANSPDDYTVTPDCNTANQEPGSVFLFFGTPAERPLSFTRGSRITVRVTSPGGAIFFHGISYSAVLQSFEGRTVIFEEALTTEDDSIGGGFSVEITPIPSEYLYNQVSPSFFFIFLFFLFA